ncbi:MAG: hypothetical protein ACRDYZ_12060 [Acidimicrobiales bacterium]
MATVSLAYTFSDGDTIGVEVEVDDSYPDCVDEARKTAVNAFEQALAAACDQLGGGDDDD